MDEKQLVLLVRNNDVDSFNKLFFKYGEKVFCFAFSLLKNREDARAVVQETFSRIWERRKEIDPSRSFKSFLFKISYHLIIDQLRHRLKEKEYRHYLGYFFDASFRGDENAPDREILMEAIEKAVDELPAKRRDIYKLSRCEGLSYKEIAGRMDISVKTVENQIHLALKHIKRSLHKECLT